MKNIQAFPNDMHPLNDPENNFRGMTLRDYFAGQAIIGILNFDPSSRKRYAKAFAEEAYAIADAMLKAGKE